MKKKTIIIIVSIVVAIAIIGAVVGIIISQSGENGGSSKKEKVKITPSASKSVEYEKYDNGLVSLDIPKGWKVEVAATDYIHYTFKVYNSEDPNYMIFFNLKLEGFLKSTRARNTYNKLYPESGFAKLPAIDPQTTESFYKVWNETAKYANEVDLKTNFLPYFNDFTIIEDIGDSSLGGDILRATFKDSKGTLVQGLFTANVKDVGSYYINEDMFNLLSPQVDVAPLNVYNTMFMTAPDSEFNDWQEVLDHCLGTIEFSQDFVNGFNREETQLVATIQANQKIYDQISDMIMSSWEARNDSYDRISQKQSDATLGYERVYDTETGDIYKADLGFTDDYTGDKYQPITDDMYALPTSGYIEKVN